MAERPSERLEALGIRLPPPPRPVGSYASVVLEGGFAWVAGQIVTEGGSAVSAGRVGESVSPSEARALARRCALQSLSALSESLGSIDRVRRVVRLAVYVAASPDFTAAHEVANGASELLVELLGPMGRGSRVAMGVASLPLGAPVEVELCVAVGAPDG